MEAGIPTDKSQLRRSPITLITPSIPVFIRRF